MSQFRDLYGVLYLVAKQDPKGSHFRKSPSKTMLDWTVWTLGLSGDPHEQLYAMICESHFWKEQV